MTSFDMWPAGITRVRVSKTINQPCFTFKEKYLWTGKEHVREMVIWLAPKKLASFSILWGAVWFIAGGPIQSSVLTFHYLRQTRHIIGRMEENYQTNNMNGWQKCKNLFCTLCVYFSPTTYVVVSNSVSPDSLSSNIFHPIEIEIPLIAIQRRHLPREGKKSHVCGKKG